MSTQYITFMWQIWHNFLMTSRCGSTDTYWPTDVITVSDVNAAHWMLSERIPNVPSVRMLPLGLRTYFATLSNTQGKCWAYIYCVFMNRIDNFWLKCNWNVCPLVQLTICKLWIREYFGGEQAANYFMNQWCPRLLAHIWIMRTQRPIIRMYLSWCIKLYGYHTTQLDTICANNWSE